MTETQIALFRSLFKGRDDVFAIRWEREGRSGYMPAYDFNREEFNKTLNTEDATYIWQCEKNREALKQNLKIVEEALAIIRKTGRQPYLHIAPAQFSRIIHDYSDVNKGFLQWKGVLEEMMV